MTPHRSLEPPALMPAGRPAKTIVLGALSVAPAAIVAVAVVQFFLVFGRIEHVATTPFAPEPVGIEAGIARYAALVMVAAVLTLVALVVLLVDVCTGTTITGDRRVMWLLVLLFANVVGFPVYWYVVHWRRPPAVSGAC
jgi:hypothetical protein